MIKIIAYFLSIILFISCSNNKPADNKQKKIFNNKMKIYLDTINTDKFWALVDKAVNASNGDDKLKKEFLISELTKLSLEEIKYFEIAFRKVVLDADDYKVMAAQKIIEGFVSDDSYLYFRCWLIGQGKTVYTETLKNPDFLASIVEKGELYDFESLMYVTTEAYSKKTGKEEDESFPRDIAYAMGLDYDSGAPPTKGEDWTEEQLPKLYPKLWTKFN
jgi:hypothetical protein